MPFTTNKLLSVPAAASLSGVWGAGDPGNDLNTGVMGKLDNMLGGVVSKSLSSSNVTLTTTESENLVIRLTGTLTANVTITTPGIGFYIVDNQTTGSFTVTLQYTGGVGGTPTMPQAGVTLVVVDSTNGVRIVLPGDLLAIEALTGTGILKRTGTNTWSLSTGVTDLAATTANRLFGTDGSGTSGLITLGAALTQAAGVLNGVAATSSEVAALAATAPTYPSVQQYHPLHPKAHGRVTGAGSLESGSYNVSGVNKTGTGIYVITLGVTMANTNYTVMTCPGQAAVNAAPTNTSTTSITMTVTNTGSAAAVDRAFNFMVMGTLA